MKGFKLASLAVLIPFGCATIPDDAPPAFHEAKAEIDRMDDLDADDTMPKTAEFAEDTLDKAVKNLKQARDGKKGYSTERATEQAELARDTAAQVNKMHNNILAWDNNRGTFSEALVRLDNENVTQTASGEVREIESPLARLSGTELVSTVAYFETNTNAPIAVIEKELESMVRILEKDPNARVTLTGTADHRGDSQMNRRLAQMRAEKVANMIGERGIDKKRINIKSAGEEETVFSNTNEPAKLQLDRRVIATLSL